MACPTYGSGWKSTISSFGGRLMPRPCLGFDTTLRCTRNLKDGPKELLESVHWCRNGSIRKTAQVGLK